MDIARHQILYISLMVKIECNYIIIKFTTEAYNSQVETLNLIHRQQIE
jgi:hypothetical protein